MSEAMENRAAQNMVNADHSMLDLLYSSYHVFIYPFHFANAEAFENIESNGWDSEPNNIKNILTKNSRDKDGNDEKRRQQYAVYRYFLPKARDNVFNIQDASEDCSIYIKEGAKDAKYEIELFGDKTGDNSPEKKSALKNNNPDSHTLKLSIDEIRLTIYKKLNIGLISFRMHNDNNSLRHIKWINQFGRRLFMPYYSLSENGTKPFCNLTAKNIKIEWKNGEILTLADLPQTAEKKEYQKNDLSGLSELIFGDRNNTLEGVLDDRMFTCCLIRDNALSDNIKNHANSVSENFFETAPKSAENDVNNLYDTLYSLLFVDDESPSCQDRAMERRKLSENCDTRWTGYGTIHGVTEYSMICVTGMGNDLRYSVIEPFLNEYVELARLGLAQAASIHEQENRIETINKNIEPDNIMPDTTINDINKAWKRYILFQNDLFIPEVTFEEQGREMYDLVKKSLRLESLNEYLYSGLEHLHSLASMESDMASQEAERANAKANDRINYSINIITILGTGLALIALFQDSLGVEGAFKSGILNVIYRVLIFLAYTSGIFIIGIGYNHMKFEDTDQNKGKINDREVTPQEKKRKRLFLVFRIVSWVFIVLAFLAIFPLLMHS